MIRQISNKIKLAALAIPAFAEGENIIKIESTDLVNYENVAKMTVSSVLAGIIYAVLSITAIIFFVLLIMGGFKWLTSGGDEKKVAAARASITSALIGLAIVFSAWAIMTLLGSVLGFSIFNLTIPKLVG